MGVDHVIVSLQGRVIDSLLLLWYYAPDSVYVFELSMGRVSLSRVCLRVTQSREHTTALPQLYVRLLGCQLMERVISRCIDYETLPA